MNHRRIAYSPSIAASVQASRLSMLARLNNGTVPQSAPWYSIKASSGTAEVMIYDEIGYYGVTASDFVREVMAIDASTIKLRLNSPGGDVFDGVAIYNALVEHDANVEVHVDALAASAASVIAMAGDEIVIAESGQLMLHDAWGIAMGNEGDMLALAAELGRISVQIAGIYADRAGGTADDWRAVMRADSQRGTYYTGAEAVTAGLATRTKGNKKASPSDKTDGMIYNQAGRPDTAPEHEPETPFTFDVAGLTSALKGAF